MKTVLKSVLLLTSLSTFAQDFGPLPWEALYLKNNCRDVRSEMCQVVSSADIAEEMEVFDRYSQVRYETVLERLASLEDFANQIRAIAGDDESLESFKFYHQAADKIQNLAEIDESIPQALEAFDPENSTVKKEMQKLYESALKYEEAIKQAENDEAKESLLVGMRTKMLNTIKEKKIKNLYRYYEYRFFKNDKNIVRAMLRKDDDVSFRIDQYVDFDDMCSNAHTTLTHIAISKEIQVNESIYYPTVEEDMLTLLDDEKVIKGIIDGPKLSISCKRITNLIFNEPEVNYYEDKNHLEIETMKTGFTSGSVTTSATNSVDDELRKIYNK